MTEPNPLVVAPENEDAQPLDWEGAGLPSSVSDLDAAVSAEHVDPAEVAYNVAAVGLDALDAVMNPLDALTTAGVGWLIEHVWFLHEPLDALAGDPTQIVAQAQTWHNVGGELAAVGGEYRRSAAALPAWDGMAGDGYRATAERFGAALDESARGAGALADLVLTTGAQVATVRALVRDAIAEFLGGVLQDVVLYGVAALVTAGGALGVGAVRIIVRAVDLAEEFGRWIRRLLNTLTLAGGTAAQISAAIQQTARAVAAAMPTLRAVHQAADELKLGWSVEAGKQLTKYEQQQRGWGPAPA